MPKITNPLTRYKKFLVHYAANKFHIGNTCKAAGISRVTFYAWMKDPVFEQEVKNLEQSIIDTCEAKLIESIEKGDLSTAKYWLEHRAGHRGWSNTQQVEATGTIKLEIIRNIIDRGTTQSEIKSDDICNNK